MFRNPVFNLRYVMMAVCVGVSSMSVIEGMHLEATQSAISKWSHLVPSGSLKTAIDTLVPQVLESREKMKELVTLICDPGNSSKYANYAHMIFTSVFFGINNSERNKLERMLDVIADHRGSGGGLDPTTYLMYYDSGRYDDCLPEDDDDFKASKW